MTTKEKLPQSRSTKPPINYTTLPDEGVVYITPEEFAARFSVTSHSIRRKCCEGKIPGAIKIGRYWRIPVGKEAHVRQD